MVSALLLALAQGVTVPDTLTLDRALELADRARGQVALARAGVDRARADARRGTAVPNPSVKYEHAGDAPSSTLEVIQPLAWLAGTFDIRAAGDASIRRARADSVSRRYAVVAEVTAAFYRVVAANEMNRLATLQTLAADTLLQLTTRRVALGDLSELERDQASHEAAMLRLLAARSQEDMRVARGALERAIGTMIPTTTVVSGSLNTTASVRTSTAKAPRVEAAVEDSIAAAARLRAARWRQFPVPSLLTKWEWGGAPNATSNTIVGFSVPFPLWQFGQHDVALARAEAVEKSATALETRLETARQIDEARIRMTAARERATEAAEVLFPTAQRLRVGAIRLFEAGRTGIFPVFDAFRREREAAIIMVQELEAMHTATAMLRALIGVTP